MVSKIGRYEIPLDAVQVVQLRTGIKGYLRPGYDVILSSGLKLYLTDSEKSELDKARETHSEVLKVMAMVNHQQKVNRPS